jgi:hypothetical protein
MTFSAEARPPTTPAVFPIPHHKSSASWSSTSARLLPSKICREIPYPTASRRVMSTLGRHANRPNDIPMSKPPPLARLMAARGGFLPRVGLGATLPQVMYADPSLFNVDEDFLGMSLVLRRKGLGSL